MRKKGEEREGERERGREGERERGREGERERRREGERERESINKWIIKDGTHI